MIKNSLFIILFFVSTACFAQAQDLDTPQKVVETIVFAMNEGDYERVIALTDPHQQKPVDLYSGLRHAYQRYQSFGGVTSVRFLETRMINPGKIHVRYLIFFMKDVTLEQKMFLVKTQAGWRSQF